MHQVINAIYAFTQRDTIFRQPKGIEASCLANFKTITTLVYPVGIRGKQADSDYHSQLCGKVSGCNPVSDNWEHNSGHFGENRKFINL